ncbi:inositol-1-monophosphatase [Paraferrimonas sedimenticola]|uniref:Inositol-1-monophosphatase n=1 Tax=Paraferrimonas sedimenticola TaxID=375674 RepID=A0AA37VX96_9GAMM|nr:inositol-1-monophosphatase [Paraferrimonas sedimenticola]GLP95185.1 inositol monophosphatase [Paraferrimonas sedimenticola]
MHPMMTIAVRAARAAGTVITRAYAQMDKVKVEAKGQNDYVTSVDKEAEQAIIYNIHKAYPDHRIVAEESGETHGESDEYLWIIDPLDGTTNFVQGIPHFAVSIALQVKGKTEVAVVYDPLRDELFSATRGQGAQMNGFRIRVPQNNELAGGIVATGFPFKARQHTDTYMTLLGEMFSHAADMRRAGSAALDLVYTAAGRLDGYFELCLKPWDIAAGELIAREAGAMVTDINGGHNYMKSGHIVAGGPKVTQAMLKAMRPHLSEALKLS